MHRLLLTLAVALPLAACGLISSDVDDFNLSLPEKQFTVDTAAWNLQVTGTLPSVPCSVDCATQASQVCGAEAACTGSCVSGACNVAVAVSLYQSVDLAVEKPELKKVDQGPGIRVRVQEILFTVTENSLNVDTPRFDVYMAPVTILGPEGADLVGHVDPIPAGSTPSGGLLFEETGKATMEEYMSAYMTPFNFIVAATIDLGPGDPVPQGKLSGKITGTATADAF